MNIQDWVAQLLAAAEPLDWERYSVTMEPTTWKALWADIAATQEYDDGLETALRLLQATQVYRPRLGTRGAETNEILLYRSILSMLDKADRWHTYLAVWETIWAHTRLCQVVPQDTRARGDSRFRSFVRRSDGGFGAEPPVYGAASPKTVALHFLYAQGHRKAAIERRLARTTTQTPIATQRRLSPTALTAEAIQARLARVHGGEA